MQFAVFLGGEPVLSRKGGMPESDISDPVQEYRAALTGFAADMRALYEASGSPGLKELNARSVEAKRLTLSPSGISGILNGKRFPSMNYTLEVVRLLALGGEVAESDIMGGWRQRWLTVER
jgi:adenylate kinase